MRGLTVWLGLVAVTACATSGTTATGAAATQDAITADDAGAGADVGAAAEVEPSCPSGDKWLLGDEGSPLMHPGRACVSCHQSDWEAPKLLFAGTVFTGGSLTPLTVTVVS